MRHAGRVDMTRTALEGFGKSLLADRRGGDRGDRQLHGGVAGAVAVRGAGGDRQSAAGEGDRPCPCEDRQGRRRHAGEPACGRLPAGDLDAGCGDRAAAPAGGAALPGRPASHADQERGAFDPARASDPEVPACRSVQPAAAGPGWRASRCRTTSGPRSSATFANSTGSARTSRVLDREIAESALGRCGDQAADDDHRRQPHGGRRA